MAPHVAYVLRAQLHELQLRTADAVESEPRHDVNGHAAAVMCPLHEAVNLIDADYMNALTFSQLSHAPARLREVPKRHVLAKRHGSYGVARHLDILSHRVHLIVERKPLCLGDTAL